MQQDDLDALNTLYPVCDHRVLSPQCFKTESYIGLVRLSVIVGLTPDPNSDPNPDPDPNPI